MRFAYIDSNGNEVPIPSIDALALRIELGAITDETQLYDAQADQWGPATSHEIYHTLARSSADDDGFIAPPPVAAAPVVDDDDDEVVLPSAEQSAESLLQEAEDEAKSEEASVEIAAAEAPAAEAEAPSDDPEAAEPVEEAADDLGFDTLELAPALEPLAADDAEIDLSPPEDDSIVGDGDERAPGEPFDFGEMAGLESEATFEAPSDSGSEAAEADAPMDFSGSSDEPLGFTPDFEEGPTPDFSGGMELEDPMEFTTSGFDPNSSSLELETPMSDFTPDSPPGWMDQQADASTPDEEVMDFSSVSTDAIADSTPDADTGQAKTKPSRPKIRRRRNLAGPLVSIVVLIAAGVGAYAAWPMIQEWWEARNAPEEPLVVIPSLSAELMPTMESAADQAFASLLAAARQETGPQPASPPRQWLEGVYLANASSYDGVEAFWDAMSQTMESFRAMDVAAFDASVAAAIGAGLSAEDADAVRARADSGFVAAAAEREAAFEQAATLIDSAIRFHQFLVANEANIEHAPAATVTTDPITEVDPATDEIRAAMDELMSAVLSGLADLGYRDVVTADGLWQVILASVQEAGIQ